MGQGLPPQVKDKSKRTKVFAWQVPVQVGAAKGDIAGTLYWVPKPGGGAPVGRDRGAAGARRARRGRGGRRAPPARRRRGRGGRRRRRGSRPGEATRSSRSSWRRSPASPSAAPSAQAHAELEGTSPARGAVLKTQPKAVVFRFGESVEGNFGAVRVFDAKGQRVDDNKVVHPGGRGSEVAVGLRPHLKDGTYTATYRVISADSHPVSGGVVFTIGQAGAGSAETVADLLAGSNVGAVTETAFGITRGLDYLAIALGVGGLAFLLAAWRPALAFAAGAGAGWPEASAVFAARARRLLWVAVGMGVVSGAAGIVLQGATASGTSFWSALDASVVREVLGTRFGTVWGLRVIAWLVLGGVLIAGASTRAVAVLRPAAVGAAGVAPAPAPTRGVLAALALPAAFLLVSPALAGHATTLHPVAALLPLDVVHVTAMSVWVGGLVMLLFVLPGATRRLEPRGAQSPAGRGARALLAHGAGLRGGAAGHRGHRRR